MIWSQKNLKVVARWVTFLYVGTLLVLIYPLDAIGQSSRKPLRRLFNQVGEPEKGADPTRCPDLGMGEWLSQERIVFISDEITPDLAEQVIVQLLFLDARAAGQDIYLYINSVGGDVKAGLAIYDVMRSLRSDVVTVSLGEASSMASVLLASGTKGKRLALPNARMMIHQPLSSVGGQASDIAIEAREIVYLKNKLNQMLATMTGQSLKRIEADSDRDFYLSAQEAKAYGLVDQVVNRLPSASNPLK